MGGSKKVDISRRSFLRRSALLVSALGVGASIESGLLDAIGRRARQRWGTAMAANNRVIRVLDGPGRAGLDFKSLFAQKTLAENPSSAWASNTNFTFSQANIGAYDAGNGRSLYLVKTDGTQLGVDNPLGEFAANIAYSQSINPSRTSHSSRWTMRGDGNGVVPGKASAVINPGKAAVDTVLWNDGPNVDNPGPGTLNAVNSESDFVGLYKDVPMYFTREELKHLVGTFENNTANLLSDGALQKLDSIWSQARPIKGQEDVFAIGKSGRAGTLFSINLDPAIADPYVPETLDGSGRDINTLMTDFGYNMGQLGGINLGEAMFNMYRAMAHPASLLLSGIFAMNSGDWHGDTDVANDNMGSKQYQWASRFTASLAGFAKNASNTPDLLNDPDGSQGMSLWDNVLITMSSEFGRSILNSNDNGDRSPHSIVLMGGVVNGGTIGDTNVLASASGNGFGGYGEGRATGVDASGNPDANAPLISDADIYATQLKMIGWSDADINNVMPGTAKDFLVKG